MSNTVPGIPSTFNEFRLWGNNFAALITASPTTYGLTSGNALVIQGVADAFEAAYTISNNPSTNTKTTREATRDAKVAAAAIYRLYYGIVKADPAVLGADKVALGIVYPNSPPSPIPPPTSFPQISIITQSPLNMTLDWRDSDAASGHAKPVGATLCLLFRTIGTTVASDPDAAMFYGAFTKRPFQVVFPDGSQGKHSTFFSQWSNAKGQRGIWSGGVDQIIS